jgi:2-C-methyl-D-erythritol 4-phosphate cytidylyltransferase
LQRFGEVDCIDELIVVTREELLPEFGDLLKALQLRKPYRVVAGGSRRQDSVWNGLQAVSPKSEIVAIQDGARPCTPAEVIAATIAAAREIGAAVAAQRVTDTIKESEDGRSIARHLERSRLWSVQTPQTFRVDVIRRALEAVRQKGLSVTDDTAACELIGQPVRLVETMAPNPKVTVPADLAYVGMLLR